MHIDGHLSWKCITRNPWLFNVKLCRGHHTRMISCQASKRKFCDSYSMHRSYILDQLACPSIAADWMVYSQHLPALRLPWWCVIQLMLNIICSSACFQMTQRALPSVALGTCFLLEWWEGITVCALAIL